MKQYDIIVIGSGTGGGVARKCADAGKKVAIVDEQQYGGTCPLRGCMPKKTLVGVAQTLALNKQLYDRGIKKIAAPSWSDLIKFKNEITQPKSTEKIEALEKAGVSIYYGKAKIIDEKSMQVNEDILQAEKIVFASGAAPIKLGIPGEDLLIDSTAFLEMKELPKEILFVGGGFIAFEFACIMAQFGVKATIVHEEALPLNNFEPDLVKLLVEVCMTDGINTILNTTVTKIIKTAEGIEVHATQNNKGIVLKTEVAVHAAGRAPALADLGLEKMSIIYNKKGIEVNEYMQSVSNEHVYSCGDASDSGLPLTPVASREAAVVIENLLNGNNKKVAYGHIPSSVFSIPPLAMVGYTEAEAKEKKINYTVKFKETTNSLSSQMINEPVAAFKILINKDNDEIIGAHLLGSQAPEVINIFAVAMNAGIKAADLKQTIFSYPTIASGIENML